MAYDVTDWKTKELSDFKIPLKAFFTHERDDWHPEQPKVINAETMEVEMECGIEQTIKGKLSDGVIEVSEIEMSGEGSGTFKNWILDPALKESTGTLRASLVWEGGDALSKLTVIDGVITEEEVDF